MKLSVSLKNESKEQSLKYKSSFVEIPISRKSNNDYKSRSDAQKILSTYTNKSKENQNSITFRKSIQYKKQNNHENRKDPETISYLQKPTESDINDNSLKTNSLPEKVLDKSKSEASLVKIKAKKLICDRSNEYKKSQFDNRNHREFKTFQLKDEKDRSESYSFQPEINHISKTDKRSFTEFYSSQLETFERRQQKINDIKKIEEEKNKICETFTPSICKKSEALFKKITIGVSINASERLHLKKKNDSNNLEIPFEESQGAFKKIYNSSPKHRMISFSFTPTLFKSKYSRARDIQIHHSTEDNLNGSSRKKFKSFSGSNDLHLTQQSSFQVLDKSERILFSQFQKLYEANFKSIFLTNKNNPFNLDSFSNFNIVYLLRTLNFIFDEKNELQKIKQLFSIINCSGISSLKDNVFFHLLAILKINPPDSFNIYELGDMIGNEYRDQFNEINDYITYLHKEYIVLYLNFRSNFINKRKDIPKKYSFSPKINKSFLKMKKCVSERNLLRIEDRTLLDQQSLFKKMHTFKLNQLHQDIDTNRRPNPQKPKEIFNSFSHTIKQRSMKSKNTINRLTIDLTLLRGKKDYEKKNLYVNQLKKQMLEQKSISSSSQLLNKNSKIHFNTLNCESPSESENKTLLGYKIPNEEKFKISNKKIEKHRYDNNTDINKKKNKINKQKENKVKGNDYISSSNQFQIMPKEKVLFPQFTKGIYK